ncbi:MAG: hypothetical protein ABI051_16445 [Vicinamibacterales bacterium]
MGDAGEGLVDAESRIQERMEELERERAERHGPPVGDPEPVRALESLRLARVEMARQLEQTVHDRRRQVITDALAEIDRRMAELTRTIG